MSFAPVKTNFLKKDFLNKNNCFHNLKGETQLLSYNPPSVKNFWMQPCGAVRVYWSRVPIRSARRLAGRHRPETPVLIRFLSSPTASHRTAPHCTASNFLSHFEWPVGLWRWPIRAPHE